MEHLKEQEKSNIVSAKVKTSSTHELTNLNPVHRVPIEVWELITDHVNSSKDLINLSKAVPLCNKITYPVRVEWLFDQVFPLILSEFLNHKKDVLNCRLVCKRWRYGIDNFLENNAIQRPAFGDDDIEISKKLDFQHEILERFCHSQDFCYRIKLYQRQKDKMLKEAINYPSNPVVGRCAYIEYPQRSCLLERVDKDSLDVKYLQTFGSHIWFLQVGIREGRQINYLKRLVELFSLIDIPNLKKLELKEFSIYSGRRCAEEDSETTSEELFYYYNSLTEGQRNRFPKNLETLIIQKQDQYCSYPLKRIIMNLFHSESITSLNVNIFTLSADFNFPNLVYLSIWLVSEDSVQGFLRLNSPIRRLRLRFNMNAEVDMDLVFKGLNRLQNTLKYLDLDLDQITSSDLSPLSVPVNVKPFMRPGGLQLPNIKTLKFRYYYPPSFNFITGLSSLQYMFLDLTLDDEWTYFVNDNFVSKEPKNEVLDIKYYLDKICGKGEDHMEQPMLYDSIIWKEFKRLLIFDMYICHKHFNYDGKQNIRSRFFRNYYDLFERKKFEVRFI